MKILVVDDEKNIRKTLSFCLSTLKHDVIAVDSFDKALEEARRNDFILAFVDLKLGDKDGMELIPRLLADSPTLKIIVITAFSSFETAVESIKQGAYDYIAKPFTVDQIKLAVNRVSEIYRLEQENRELKTGMDRNSPGLFLSTTSPVMLEVLETLTTAAQSDAIVLLQGESGTGKTALARAVHNGSPRAGKPFVTISCPSIPSELLESELFGYAEGAFTGAVRENTGKIAAGEGGTLFLDEIGEIPNNLQLKLLRFLQEKEYERIGETTPRKADVRVIAATNIDLSEAVKAGQFREDLYYRLNVINVRVPSLRNRREDIIPFAEMFLSHFSEINHKEIDSIDDTAKGVLSRFDWPGNIRELKNYIERAVILGKGKTLSLRDLPDNLDPVESSIKVGDPVSLSSLEELHIRLVVESASSLQEAADILGIDKATLWRKRKQYGLLSIAEINE